jgi:hypothetical protein
MTEGRRKVYKEELHPIKVYVRDGLFSTYERDEKCLEYRVFQKELYNYLDFKCGSARGGGIGYYSTMCMRGIVYLDMLQEFLIPSLWLRYGPLDLGVRVTVDVP